MRQYGDLLDTTIMSQKNYIVSKKVLHLLHVLFLVMLNERLDFNGL